MGNKRLHTLDTLRTALQKLLLTHPWDDVSVQMIAEAGEVSVGTFYNYFDCRHEALMDLKAELTNVLKGDLIFLLKTYAYSSEKLTILIKYFTLLSNSESTWSYYLYSGSAYSDRLDNGIKDILTCLILEGVKQKRMDVSDVDQAVHFIEAGLFSHAKRGVNQIDSLIDLVLIMLGVSTEERQQVFSIVCPITPLSQLPMSILTSSRPEAIYE